MDTLYYVLSPFTWLLNFFYSVFENYGLSIICFAVVVKIVLFPFSLKGKKSMIKMNMMSAQQQQLQKQYGKNRERYNEEVQKLYEKEGVNPMGGCLWSMLPLFVLLPLYAIIRQPLKFMMGLDEQQILKVANALNWDSIAQSMSWATEKTIASAIEDTTAAGGVISGFADSGYNQLYLASMIDESTLSSVTSALGESTGVFAVNFDFFGLNLAMVPNWRIWEDLSWASIGLVVLVLVSVATGFLFSRITMKTNKMNSTSQSASMEQTNKTMMYTMPLMSLWIGFVMPAGLCVYWIANNLLSMIQETIAGKILKKDYEQARLEAEERARQEKIEEKERKAKASEERARRIEEEKKNRGKKKPAQKPKLEEASAVDKNDSKVGIRAYARGRNYDPNRFGGVTPYTDGTTPVQTTIEEPVEELEETVVQGIEAPETQVEETTVDTAMEQTLEENDKEGDA